MSKTPGLEEAFAQLDNLLKQMEAPDISLEESFNKYTQGMELIKQCSLSIDKIEKQLEILEENS